MNKSGIFARGFLSLDHMMLTQYGELRGKSLVPEISVYNTSSADMQFVLSTSTGQLNRYLNKIWIIEGISKCKMKVLGSDVEWSTIPHRRFDEKMLDPSTEDSLYDYLDKDIELSTSAFTSVIKGSDLRIIQVDTLEDSNSNDIYWQFVSPVIQKNISDILKITNGDDIDVQLNLDPFIVNFTGIDNSIGDYVKVFVNEYDVIEYRGYSSAIYTKNSFDANRVSDYLNHSILMNASDMNSDMNTISEGAYSFKLHLKEHSDITNRNLKLLFVFGAPTIDRIAKHYSGYISPASYNYLRMSEGMNSGAMVTND